MGARYIGRFAPSPTGPLHAGSLVAALASWLDARAHGGQWLVRIEDVDTPRTVPGADHLILQQLAACGLHPNAPPVWQSQRGALYQAALDQLKAHGLAYPCTCSRKEIDTELQRLGRSRPRNGELVYPGTCRPEPEGWAGKDFAPCPPPALRAPPLPAQNPYPPSLLPGTVRRVAWRLRLPISEPNQPPALIEQAQAAIQSIANCIVQWHDRRLGLPAQDAVQDVGQEVGDFVLQRADGCWAYQLAVVVDDAAQGITHVVRGADLADNTPRQILLQRALGLPTPQYLHTPLVLGKNGEKLSKQNGAQALDTASPQQALQELRWAAQALALPSTHATSVPDALAHWVRTWPLPTMQA